MNFARMHLAILIICFSLTSNAQGTDTKEQFIIDSLNTVIHNPNNHDTAIINAYWDLSDIYYISDQDTFRSILQEIKIIVEQGFAEASSDELKTYYNTALGNVFSYFGDSYDLTGDKDKAADYYQKAITKFKEVDDKIEIIQNLIFLGRMYREKGELQKSLEIHKRGLKWAQEAEDEKMIASCYNSIAVTFSQQGNITEALEYFLKALKSAEKLGNQQSIADFSINIGSRYSATGDYKEALKYFKRALEIYEALELKVGIAYSLNHIGGTFEDKGDAVTALVYYKKVLKIRKDLGDQRGISNSLSLIGQIYRTMGNKKIALEHLQQSLTIAETLGNKGLITRNLNNLSGIYLNQGKVKKAKNMAIRSLQYAREAGYPKSISAASKILYKIYKKERDFENALALYELETKMNDSLSNDANIKKIARLEAEYKFEKEKEKITSELLITKENSKFKTSALIGILSLLLITLIYSFIIYGKKIKEEALNKVLTASSEVVLMQKQQLEKSVTLLQKDLVGKQQANDSYYFVQSALQINFTDIIMLESNNNYVLIYVAGRDNPLLERIKMIELIEDFPRSMFIKVHRSFFVNVDHIVSRPSKYILKLSNGIVTNASRNYVDNLADKFLKKGFHVQ